MKKAYRTLSLGLCLVLVCGCHTFGGGKFVGSLREGETDVDALHRVVDTWKAYTANRDIDRLMRLYSSDFEHVDWGDKAQFESFLRDGVEMGYLDNAVINITDTKITVDGANAEAYPIHLTARFGTVCICLKLTKESKGWMIAGMTMERAKDTDSL